MTRWGRAAWETVVGAEDCEIGDGSGWQGWEANATEIATEDVASNNEALGEGTEEKMGGFFLPIQVPNSLHHLVGDLPRRLQAGAKSGHRDPFSQSQKHELGNQGVDWSLGVGSR